MCHCNPAPPDCPPGEVYNVMCFPMDGMFVGIGFMLVLVAGILLVARYRSDVVSDDENLK